MNWLIAIIALLCINSTTSQYFLDFQHAYVGVPEEVFHRNMDTNDVFTAASSPPVTTISSTPEPTFSFEAPIDTSPPDLEDSPTTILDIGLETITEKEVNVNDFDSTTVLKTTSDAVNTFFESVDKDAEDKSPICPNFADCKPRFNTETEPGRGKSNFRLRPTINPKKLHRMKSEDNSEPIQSDIFPVSNKLAEQYTVELIGDDYYDYY